MAKEFDLKKLEQMAKKIRRDILAMLTEAGSGHPGGSLSSTEIMTVLYFFEMNHKPENPQWQDRDRFILSKGHACPVLYAALAESGYFPVEELKTLRKLGSRLQGHPHRLKTPGIDMSSGSLGQGLSVANGLALASKLDQKSYRAYCLMGCGEVQEGSVWEAAMAAAHYKLDNICAIIDYNQLQIDGHVEKVKGIAPLADKWRAFNWNAIEVNGHSIPELIDAFKKARETKGKPSILIAHTIKGKGVSFMENKPEWHGVVPTKEQTELALKELEVVLS
ncbi:MAG: transketolase [Candidatus Firestonebacteria bacterium]